MISRLARSQMRNFGSIRPLRITSSTKPRSSSMASVAACVVAARGLSLTRDSGLIPLTQVTATVGLAADLKAAEDESNPGPPKMADHAFGFLCRSPTGPEVGKSGKQ